MRATSVGGRSTPSEPGSTGEPTGARSDDLHRPRHRLRRALAGDRADRRASASSCSSGWSARAAAGRSSRSLTLATLAAAAGLCIWQWGEREGPGRRRAAARRPGARDRALIAILAAAFVHPALLARAGGRARRGRAGHGEFQALLLGSVLGHGRCSPRRRTWSPSSSRSSCSRSRSTSSAARRPAARALARVGAQVPDRRLARLGDAALRDGVHLRRLGLDRLRRRSRRDRRAALARRPAGPDRDRAGRHRARLQDLDRALPPVDARRLPGRADPGDRVHGGGDQGGRLRRLRALLRRRARPRGRTTGSRRWRCSPRSRSSSATSARSARTR